MVSATSSTVLLPSPRLGAPPPSGRHRQQRREMKNAWATHLHRTAARAWWAAYCHQQRLSRGDFLLRGSPFPSPFEAPPCDSDRAVGGKRLADGQTVCFPAPATYPPTIVRPTLNEARTRRSTPIATVKRVRSAATPAGATTGTAVACCCSCLVASGATAVAAPVHSRRGPLPHRLPQTTRRTPLKPVPHRRQGGRAAADIYEV